MREAGVSLVHLEPVARELQRPAVFGHIADDVIRRSIGNPGLYLERNVHFGTAQSCKVRDDLLGHPAGIAANSRRVKDNAPVVSTRFR